MWQEEHNARPTSWISTGGCSGSRRPTKVDFCFSLLRAIKHVFLCPSEIFLHGHIMDILLVRVSQGQQEVTVERIDRV